MSDFFKQIAIDGPAGAGKSTIAKLVSNRLGFCYIDTGATYRAVALVAGEAGVTEESDVMKAIEDSGLSFSIGDGHIDIKLKGERVEDGRLRSAEVANMASIVSTYLSVRSYLGDIQREMAQNNGVVMDGRDVGTNIMTNAMLKIFLTASVEERAIRRMKDFIDKNIEVDIEELKKDIADRDYRDSHREHNPLTQANDAILIDSSNMSIEQVVNEILDIYSKRLKEYESK